jgi:acetyltransferase
MIEISRSDELLPVAQTLIGQPAVAAGAGIAILSDGGGHATIAVDALESAGLPPATLAADTVNALRTTLGSVAAVNNPVDLAGAADRDPLVFARALEILAADDAVAAVLVVGLFGGYAIRFAESLLDAEIEAAEQLPGIARRAGVALVVHSLYAHADTQPLRVLRRAEVPVIGSLEAACRCVGALVERGAALARLDRLPADWPAVDRFATGTVAIEPVDEPLPPLAARALSLATSANPFTAARIEGRSVLVETESRALAAAFGVPLVAAHFCASPADAAAAAEQAGAHAAVRVLSPSAPHKTDAGGVALNVTPAEASRVAAQLCENVRSWCAARGVDADIRGVLVSPMLPRPVAELFVGVMRDPQFGPVLMVGAGGIEVEVRRDVARRMLPVTALDVLEMLGELRIAPVLDGHRGKPAAEKRAIVEAVLAFADCALAHPEIAEMEVNPMFVYEDGAVGVDIRVYLG